MGKTITKVERQATLDGLKWIASENIGRDLSGEMEYCKACDFCNETSCTLTQKERENKLQCATAYNKFHRRKK